MHTGRFYERNAVKTSALQDFNNHKPLKRKCTLMKIITKPKENQVYEPHSLKTKDVEVEIFITAQYVS